MCVYARVSLRPSIQEVISKTGLKRSRIASSVATGLLGMMGNKGGAGIRMRINDSTVCFVCVHLAAHREKVAERNADYHKYKKLCSWTVESFTVSSSLRIKN